MLARTNAFSGGIFSRIKMSVMVIVCAPNNERRLMDKSKSIDLLNQAIAEELLATEQYLYFHFHCENRGFLPLSKIFMRISIVEMHHVDRLAQRVLFLGGDVTMRHAGAIQKFEKVEDMLKRARELEQESVNDYNKFATASSANEDSATKTLFESLTKEEEDHYDIFDTEIINIQEFGMNYLALQAIGGSKESAKENPSIN